MSSEPLAQAPLGLPEELSAPAGERSGPAAQEEARAVRWALAAHLEEARVARWALAAHPEEARVARWAPAAHLAEARAAR